MTVTTKRPRAESVATERDAEGTAGPRPDPEQVLTRRGLSCFTSLLGG